MSNPIQPPSVLIPAPELCEAATHNGQPVPSYTAAEYRLAAAKQLRDFADELPDTRDICIAAYEISADGPYPANRALEKLTKCWQEMEFFLRKGGEVPPGVPAPVPTVRDFIDEMLRLEMHARAAADRFDPPAAMPAPPHVEPKQVEGERPNTGATKETILPSLLSASDIANRIEKNPKSVSSFLSRFAEKNKDCRVENKSKRLNEPSYLYRTADVWPALEKWMKGNEAN